MQNDSEVANIKILDPDNWQEYKNIRLKALKVDPASFGSSYEQEKNYTEEELRKNLSNPNRKTYGIRLDGKLVAIAASAFMPGEHVEHMAKIFAVFTDPDYRRHGIATKLMQQILKDLYQNSKIIKVVLSVNNEQEAAKSFYEKLGFVQSGLAQKEMKVGNRYYDQAQMELIFEDKL